MYFCFVACAFVIVSKKPLPKPKPLRFTLLSSESFVKRCSSDIQSYIPLKFIFYCTLRKVLCFILLYVEIHLSHQHHQLKSFLTIEQTQHPYRKFNHKCEDVYLESLFYFTDIYVYHMSVPHYLCCCNFSVGLEIRKCEYSNFVLFEIFFVNFWLFEFLCKFQLVNFCKKKKLAQMSICIELNQIGES